MAIFLIAKKIKNKKLKISNVKSKKRKNHKLITKKSTKVIFTTIYKYIKDTIINANKNKLKRSFG